MVQIYQSDSPIATQFWQINVLSLFKKLNHLLSDYHSLISRKVCRRFLFSNTYRRKGVKTVLCLFITLKTEYGVYSFDDGTWSLLVGSIFLTLFQNAFPCLAWLTSCTKPRMVH